MTMIDNDLFDGVELAGVATIITIECPACGRTQDAAVTAVGRGVAYCVSCHRRIEIVCCQPSLSGPFSGFGLLGPSEYKSGEG